MSIRRLAVPLALVLLAAAPAPVHPQQKSASQAYPAQPIRLIIPYSPGKSSGSDPIDLICA